MTNKIEISRELAGAIERVFVGVEKLGVKLTCAAELRALLAAPVVERQEPAAYINESALSEVNNPYGAGCGAHLNHSPSAGFVAIYTSPPTPVSVVRKLEMADVVRAHMDIPHCPVLTSNQCHALAVKLNACLDKVKELNQ